MLYEQSSVFFLGETGWWVRRPAYEGCGIYPGVLRHHWMILIREAKSVAISYTTSFWQCMEDELEGNKIEDGYMVKHDHNIN